MAYVLQVKTFTASVTKKITSANTEVTMGASAMYYSSSASTLTTDETFTATDLMWLVIRRGAYVEMKFGADPAVANGQGIRIPQGLSEVKITTVSGTVKRLSTLDQNQADTKTAAYSDGSSTSVVANEDVEAGDLVVCDQNGYFYVKFTAYDNPEQPYIAVPIGLLADATR